jgi:hypothetical protein
MSAQVGDGSVRPVKELSPESGGEKISVKELPIVSDKYVVFKCEDWDPFIEILSHLHWTGAGGEEPGQALLTSMPEPVADAEVFRHKDLVAAPIFYNASSIYQSYLELVGSHLTDDQRSYMREVVDHFFEAAEKATGLPNRKLPD